MLVFKARHEKDSTELTIQRSSDEAWELMSGYNIQGFKGQDHIHYSYLRD